MFSFSAVLQKSTEGCADPHSSRTQRKHKHDLFLFFNMHKFYNRLWLRVYGACVQGALAFKIHDIWEPERNLWEKSLTTNDLSVSWRAVLFLRGRFFIKYYPQWLNFKGKETLTFQEEKLRKRTGSEAQHAVKLYRKDKTSTNCGSFLPNQTLKSWPFLDL